METIAVAFVIATIAPTYSYVVNGIRATTTEARIPFTEPKSNAEFAGNVIVQYICGTHGALCYLGIEVFVSILENVVTIVPRLIKSELVQTIESYERKQISDLELRIRIGGIVKQSNDTDK